MTGSHWVNDAGYLVGPICITNTHSVGMVHHAATKWMIEHYRDFWFHNHVWAMPVVAETYDGVLNDINGQHITLEDALHAITSASNDAFPLGNTGGGTGMICFGFKGGTGSASRQFDIGNDRHTLGVLVQANHGIRQWFRPFGVPVGEHLSGHDVSDDQEKGSIIVIVGTDVPMLPGQLKQVAKRAAIGIGRGGTPGGNSSGDIFLCFSTANAKPIPTDDESMTPSRNQIEYIEESCLDQVYMATVQSIEEAVVNAMLAAEDMSTLRPHGQICRAIDHSDLLDVMSLYGYQSENE